MLTRGIVFVSCVLYLQTRLSTADVHIYVSPHGSDQNDGHSDKVPVKTIPHALTLAAQAKFNTSRVYIELMQGYFDLDKTLIISRNNTIMRAYRHQRVHVTGGYRIQSSSFKSVTDQKILSRLPASARAHVKVVSLRDLNITDFGIMDEYGSYRHRNSPLEVSFNGKPLRLAQYPNDGFLDIVDVPNGRNGVTFRYNSSIPQAWHGESDPWVYGFWYFAWADRAIKVKSLDAAGKTITLEHKTSHGLRIGHYEEYLNGVSNIEGGYFRFINILAALDQPGEYYMDRDNGILYMWVPNQTGSVTSTDMVYISMVNDCIFIPPYTENVQLEDFTLDSCRRNGLYAPNVKGVKLLKMEIRNTGSSAASFAGDSRQNYVSQCYIHDTCGGLWINGGNRTTLESSGNTIENNEIVRYSRVGVMGNDAINLNGVGHVVRYNHIYDSNISAIGFAGNDFIIEHNLIHHVCQATASCAAIHTGNDLTCRGNVIRYNIIHHTLNMAPGGANKGVLIDSQVSGTRVMFNSFADFSQNGWKKKYDDIKIMLKDIKSFALRKDDRFYNQHKNCSILRTSNTVHVSIGGGRYNEIINNVMYNARLRSIEVDSRGLGHYADSGLLSKLHALPYKGPVWSLRYPHLATIDSQNFSLPEGNQILRNIMFAGPNTEYIHGINNFLRTNLSRYFNISQTGFSMGSPDHYSVKNNDLRVRCYASAWANHIHFRQPPSPNSVGPLSSPVGPTYLKRGRIHLVNTSYPSVPCSFNGPPKELPLPPYLPDGSHTNHLYPVEHSGCWLNVTKCKNHSAAIGTYRDMYGERYHHAADNETMCFKRAHEQWKMCGSHRDEMVVAIYGKTGATTLGGDGCMSAMYGCPKHGGPADGHANITYGKYQRDYNGEKTHDEEGCLSHAVGIWRYCGSSPNHPVTNVYLPTGAKRTAGGGCWIDLKKCPKHRQIHGLFYDDIGSTNYQTDTSEFACLHRAEYYWVYCGSHSEFPVTATYRPTTASLTYP